MRWSHIHGQEIKPGDVIGFSGNYWHSHAINLLTYGLPWWGLSHIAVAAEAESEDLVRFDGVSPEEPYRGSCLLLFESTSLCPYPCYLQLRHHEGTQAQIPTRRILDYNGKVWHYPLSRELRPLESRRLTCYLLNYIGTGYDTIGAFRAGGVGFSWLESLFRPEDLSSIFCAEYVAAAHRHIGLFKTRSASRWNPNLLARREQRVGILRQRRRLR